MISSLKGKVIKVKDDYIILELSNGIGYKVFINQSEKIIEGDNIFLYTHHAVRENSSELFGFLRFLELEVFEMLITISGIGPKMAMSILGITTPSILKEAIISGEYEQLTKISGIGKKMAQKIVLELKNKIEKIEGIEVKETNKQDIEVIETLESLGFSKKDIMKVMDKISETSPKEKIKEALKELGKN